MSGTAGVFVMLILLALITFVVTLCARETKGPFPGLAREHKPLSVCFSASSAGNLPLRTPPAYAFPLYPGDTLS
jgi:hypothetical protein